MGQGSSTDQEGFSTFFAHLASEEPLNKVFLEEIHSLTYEGLLVLLKQLNELSKKRTDASGKYLLFGVKKGTDGTVFWKATIQIACVKINPSTGKIDSYRFLGLVEFLKVFKTLQWHNSAAEKSKSDECARSSVLETLDSIESTDSLTECCICFDRKQEILLPCAHSFCTQCIEEWNENHDTCPICREKLESTDDTWEFTETPKADDIEKEIRESLMELTDDRGSCNPS